MKKLINISLTLTILLIGMNVYADGDKTKDSKKSNTEKVLTKIENTFDAELSLESWMTEIKEFCNNEFFTEETLQLEDWMTKDFVTESMKFVESKLVLEDWMTESFTFGEEKLVLEDWMTKTFNNEDTFKEEELQLEDWMFDLKR